MPRFRYKCGNIHCSAPAEKGRRYCPRHASTPPAPDTKRRLPTGPRPRRKAPAYWRQTYGSTRWREFSAKLVKANPWCLDCAKKNKKTPSSQVDHVGGWNKRDLASFWAPPGGFEALCASCHARRTAAQVSERARAERSVAN